MWLPKVLEGNVLGFILRQWLREVLLGRMEALRQEINCLGWMATAWWELPRKRPRKL